MPGHGVNLVETEVARVEGLDICFRLVLNIEPILVRPSCSVGRTNKSAIEGANGGVTVQMMVLVSARFVVPLQ